MEIKYSAYWKTEHGGCRITNGILTDKDLQEAVRLKEDRDSIDHSKVEFSEASFDGVTL